jgi:predicted MFS family arabinose efflux permease
MAERKNAGFALAVLFSINAMNFYDRLIPGAVGESIKHDFQLSDTALGTLGTAFVVLYAFVGVPLGRLADRFSRKWMLSVGVLVWSFLTAASGFAANFRQLVALRLAVGVGEAVCAPASSSLIGDLFPARQRARALALFMMGLPIGNALCLLTSGFVIQRWGWQSAFLVAFIPGLLCAIGALFIREPERGASETHQVGAQKREGSPYWLVLRIPTMRWIILSGALHNFNMYAIGSFLVPFLIRYHGLNPELANYAAAGIYGLAGIPGLLLGGILGDRLVGTRSNSRMLIAAISILLSLPLWYFGLGQDKGVLVATILLLGAGCLLFYVYYSTVYSTIQDVIEPSLRGTAMALYFFAMYMLGGALGPVGMGWLSDFYARQAAAAGGVSLVGLEGKALTDALLPFGSAGLHSALYAIPTIGVVLTFVLFAGARTVTADAEALRRWFRETAEASPSHSPLGAPASKAPVPGAVGAE